MAGLPEIDNDERRRRQRFSALRGGKPCFWVVVGDRREALTDLSLDGLAVGTRIGDDNASVHVELQRFGMPDRIHARLRVANCFVGSEGLQCGCIFEAFEGEGRERLHDWLVAHVIATATFPITEKDAERIVSGPSLI